MALALAIAAVAPQQAAARKAPGFAADKQRKAIKHARTLNRIKAKAATKTAGTKTHVVFRPTKTTNVGHLNHTGAGTTTSNTSTPHATTLGTTTPHTGTQNTATQSTGTHTAGTQHFADVGPHLPHGPGTLAKVALALGVQPKYAAVHLRNMYFPIHRAPYRLMFGGAPKTFVALAALGIVRIDDGYWRPDGYLRISRRFCSGVSENGCQLHWRMVDFDGGGSAAQCVQYCPYAGAPPATLAVLPPPPPPPPANAACQVALFPQPNFAGEGAPTNETQPDLGATGWQNAVSSIQVQAGAWDAFTEPNFTGESMRLPTGNYATLPPGWDKKIASLQCVELGAISGQ